LFIVSVAYLLVNALIDPSSRVSTFVIFAVLLAGIPVFHLTVAKRRPT
jgi:hypothetical protein